MVRAVKEAMLKHDRVSAIAMIILLVLVASVSAVSLFELSTRDFRKEIENHLESQVVWEIKQVK